MLALNPQIHLARAPMSALLVLALGGLLACGDDPQPDPFAGQPAPESPLEDADTPDEQPRPQPDPTDDDDPAPVIDAAWAQSCMFATFECFGQDHKLDSCEHHEAASYTVARYGDGSQASFAGETMQASVHGALCFEVRPMGGGAVEILDLVTQERFALSLRGQEAGITCPDGRDEVVSADAVRAYLPEAPASDQCASTEPDDECQTDADCGDARLACCDGGDHKMCTADCGRAQPHALCGTDDECGADERCELAEAVRVCDAVACGAQGCCFLTQAMVCGANQEGDR